MKFIQVNALSFGCLAAMVVVGIVMYPSLPASIPINYDLQGVPGNYLPKLAAVLVMPIAYSVSILVVNLMIRFSPQKFAMPNSKRPMDIIVFAVGLLLLAIHIGYMMSADDIAIFHQYFGLGLAAFLVVTGNVVGKTERNFIVGIRLPWTLASIENWRATHRFAGRLMVVSGLALAVFSFYAPSLFTIVVLGLTWLLFAAVYSFVYFLNNERPS